LKSCSLGNGKGWSRGPGEEEGWEGKRRVDREKEEGEGWG